VLNESIQCLQEPNSSDYLTMKPIHRANPFRFVDTDEEQESDTNNNTPLSRPPTPPVHRAPQPLTVNKTYDDPNTVTSSNDSNHG